MRADLADTPRPTKDECLTRFTDGLLAAHEALNDFFPDAEAAARAAGARSPTEVAEKAARIRRVWGLKPIRQSA